MREVEVILQAGLSDGQRAQLLRQQYGIAEGQYRIVSRSLDARQRTLKERLLLQVLEKNEQFADTRYEKPHYQDVTHSPQQVVVVGAGPAGLFAALRLMESGVRPIVLDRGKDVSNRKRDIALINRNEVFNEESNYCFGEGGAGTFSDGKLFSRSKKRGNMQRVMELFHYFGAEKNILWERHAHIGSDRLPRIIQRMRETIQEHGGEVRFNSRVAELILSDGQCCGVRLADGSEILGASVILAIGHSAHDTYHTLHQQGILLEAKGFAMGVRVEHPQGLINQLMYHLGTRPSRVRETLGAAAYSLVTQVDGRGVYSFCMCPGGHIVPAGSTAGSCVVNGMSNSSRSSEWANSGMVVELRVEDFGTSDPASDPLAGLRLQEQLEQLAWQHGDGKQAAPAQRLRDFVEGRASHDLPASSYLPGLISSRLDQWLPPFIGDRLRQGFRDFDRKYHGFLTNEAIVVGVESRTSSPVRIVRDPLTLQSPTCRNLYPVGEGAGYAGGITSSALDGIRAAEQIVGKG